MNVQLLTAAVRGEYLERVRRDIAKAEYFVLVTAFATSDGISLLEPAMRECLGAGGKGTVVLALDRQHFNAAEVFRKLADLVELFPKLAVRIVVEHSGLLHAKAVFAKSRDGNATLLVGSANLTERAFSQNHELGLWVNLLGQPDVSRTFERFEQNLGGKPCDAKELRKLAIILDGKPPRPPSPEPQRQPPTESWEWVFGAVPSQPPIPIDTFVGDWFQAGNIVGRGRRGLDVLVIRTPGDRLERLELIDHEAKTKLTNNTIKTMSAGYGVRLLPDEDDARLRADAHKTRAILGKLTLNLPCFGLWMPRDYWDLFEQAAKEVQAAGVSIAAIRQAAERRRCELDGLGIEREIEAIVNDLCKNELVKDGRTDNLRAELIAYFRAELDRRTPDLIARAVGFRTQRQSLASELDLQRVARSFFVDLIQATFAATYRTGRWPQRFRSVVGRELAGRIAKRCEAHGGGAVDEFALRLLDHATAWEDDRMDFNKVTAQVNELIGEAEDFPIVTLDELMQSDQEGAQDDD